MRHLSFIGQFSTDIRHVSGEDNIIADMLSRIASVTSTPQIIIDDSELQREQESDDELKELLKNRNHNSVLKRITMPGTDVSVWCDFSMTNARGRPFIPKPIRPKIILAIHNIAHTDIKATHEAIRHRFIRPKFTHKEIAQYVRTCVPCQQSKVNRHTKSPYDKYLPPNNRFEHINVDIIGPMPGNGNMKYCLTIVDRYTRSAEAAPMEDMLANTVAHTIVREWLSRFGTPSRITVDRGRQFESQLFHELNQFLGTQNFRTTSYHPQSNGICERMHRTLKSSLLACDDNSWTQRLPIVLFGLRCAHKAAELVYGCNLRLPGEFFANTDFCPQTEFFSTLREHMHSLMPTQTAHHCNDAFFVHPELSVCSHVFVRVDRIRTTLIKPYESPFKIIERTDHRSPINHRTLVR